MILYLQVIGSISHQLHGDYWRLQVQLQGNDTSPTVPACRLMERGLEESRAGVQARLDSPQKVIKVRCSISYAKARTKSRS